MRDSVYIYLARDIPVFVMYCVNGESGSSLLIESTYGLYDSSSSSYFFSRPTAIRHRTSGRDGARGSSSFASRQAWPARQRISQSVRSCTEWEKRQRRYSPQRTRRRTTVRTTSQSRARSTPSSMFAEMSYSSERASTTETSSQESLRSST